MSEHWFSELEINHSSGGESEQLSGTVLITVNQRLSRHYVHQFNQVQLAAGKSWWETPAIVPIGAWLQSLHSAAVANGLSKYALLPDIVSALAWRNAVNQDETVNFLMDPELAAANAQKAWRTAHAWGCSGVKESDIDASDDHRAFARWRKHYVRYCKKNSYIDTATLADHLQSIVEGDALSAVLPKKVLLAGFLVVPTQLKNLFDALRAKGVEIESIQCEKTASTQRLAYLDDDTAFNTIAQQAKELLSQDQKLQLGIVVHDLQHRRAQVMRAFDGVFFPTLNPAEINHIGRPYDLSIGLPLTEQSAVRTALLFLKLMVNGLNHTELSSLLLSPYLPGNDQHMRARELLDRRSRNEGRRNINFFEFIALQNKTDPLRKSLEQVAKKRWGKTATAAVWADNFGGALGQLGWPGSSIDSTEYQCTEAWSACLDDMQLLDDGEQLTHYAALNTLQRLCADRLFQVETPATPIQIMGRLESHGLSFDKLWVTGLDSEQWPPVSSPTPFIPIAQQQAAGVPDASPAIRLEMAKNEIALWRSSATQLYVCHAQTRDGLELMPAQVVADIPLITAVQQPENSRSAVHAIQQSAVLEFVEDKNGPAIEQGAGVGGGAKLLENQAQCPFRAFASHRLGIRVLEEPGVGLDPRQHGILFHRAMELFWQRVETHSKLTQMSPDEREALYNAVIDESINEANVDEQMQDLQKRFLYRLISNWVEQCEVTRQPFRVVQCEQKMEIDIDGVGINIIIDRVDELESGQTVVIDYKTGRNNKLTSWTEARIESAQLPLYASVNDNVEGICFAQVFPNQYKFVGTTSEDNIVGYIKSPGSHATLSKAFDSWGTAQQHWKASIGMLASEIRSGVATITPVPKACEYCDLSSLCRIDPEDELADEQHQTDENAGDYA